MYEIKTSMLKVNRSYVKLKATGIVLHSTASPGGTDEAHVKYFNSHPDRKASAHAFIDWNSITQTVPYSEKAWHAAATANKKFLGVELCEPRGKDIAKFTEVWNRAIWYFAWLFIHVLHLKTVTKENLMSHKEVSLKWKETNHVDPVAYFKIYGKTVDIFRSEVQKEINKQLEEK